MLVEAAAKCIYSYVSVCWFVEKFPICVPSMFQFAILVVFDHVLKQFPRTRTSSVAPGRVAGRNHCDNQHYGNCYAAHSCHTVARALLFVAGIRLLLLFFTFVAAIAINLATPYASV